eukprot:4814172-Prymnesium_polylepis.1
MNWKYRRSAGHKIRKRAAQVGPEQAHALHIRLHPAVASPCARACAISRCGSLASRFRTSSRRSTSARATRRSTCSCRRSPSKPSALLFVARRLAASG